MREVSRWKALAFIYFFMLAFALTFQGIPPVLGFIVSSLGISHAQAGTLMSFFGLPGIFISIPGGILADVYGSRYIGIVSLVITLVGSLLVGFGNSYFILVAGRIISGIGALTIAIIAPRAVSQWFQKEELGMAMGIFNTGMPLATILTLNLFSRLAAFKGWRFPILLTSFYCLLVFIMFYFKFPSSPGEKKQQEKSSFKKSLNGIRNTGLSVWLVAAIWMMYNASVISYLTFGGDYYVSVGYSASYAGFLTSLLMIGSLLLSPLVGYLIDKVGKQEYIIAGSSVVLAALMFFVPRTELNPLLLGILIGIASPFVPAPVFSLVPKLLPPEKLGLGYGILSTCLNVGVLIGPLMVGLSYDRTLSYLSGFNLMAIFALSTAIIAILFPFINKSAQIKEES
ncbi:MAG: MFS transporter [Tepidanaerobacteraceae bacterium]